MTTTQSSNNKNQSVKAKVSFTSDSVKAYLQEIGRIPLLKREEEIILGKRVKKLMQLKSIKNDLEESSQFSRAAWAEAAQLTELELTRAIRLGDRARDQMVKANLRLVVSIAKKYANRNMDLLDLIQEGSVGLHRGVEKFDPAQGYRFSTYAYWWIRQAITRAVASKSRNIRLPIHIIEKLNRLKKAQRQLSQQLHRMATVSELAQELQTTEKEIQRLFKLSKQTVSLDVKLGDSDGDYELIDLLRDDSQSPEEYLLEKQMCTDIRSALDTLEYKEREVLRLRFGLDGAKPLTLAAVGDNLDISRERVRQIQRKALQRLSKNNSFELKHYLAG